ncbi:hypothetical protein [Neisseria elongata]|uniref:hypothetical protein n=1 Tax=Neisseria elongata TaxID=495 RepID=UPI00131B8887|nr:hypothetical protein [Neisseria elongata]
MLERPSENGKPFQTAFSFPNRIRTQPASAIQKFRQDCDHAAAPRIIRHIPSCQSISAIIAAGPRFQTASIPFPSIPP